MGDPFSDLTLCKAEQSKTLRWEFPHAQREHHAAQNRIFAKYMPSMSDIPSPTRRRQFSRPRTLQPSDFTLS
jgi:hypothetical protein